MPFIRVKSSTTGHEFDVTPEHASARDDWEVVDADPVQVARPPKHGHPVKAKAEPVKAEKVHPSDGARFSQRSAPSGD